MLAAMVIAIAVGMEVGRTGDDPSKGTATLSVPKLRLDPNTAPPQVLGVLPQVGATLVRQLVQAREQRPLRSLEDVRSRVRGLGPATSEQIAPYLRFAPAAGIREDQFADLDGGRAAKKPRATSRKKSRSPAPTVAQGRSELVARLAEPGAP
jgi:hypothetical protein